MVKKYLINLILIFIFIVIAIECYLIFIDYGKSNVYFYENDEYLGYKVKSNSKGIYTELNNRNFLSWIREIYPQHTMSALVLPSLSLINLL